MSGSAIIIAAVFAAVVIFGALAYGAFALMTPDRSTSDRLSEFTGGPKKSEQDLVADRIADRLAKLAQPDDEESRNVLRSKLIQAGFKSRGAPRVFSASRVGLALILPLMMVPLIPILSNPIYLAGGAIFAAAFGYYGPQLYVDNLVANRKTRLSRPLPDALDLLVTTVEAGLGLDAAFRRVADELEGAAPDLALEFQLVNHEVSAGVPRIEALRHLEQRTGVEEIRSLVNMLAQAERFGTSVARSLRIHSDVTRQKRMSKAEEEAAKVSPKLTVVMILCLMPCLFIVLLGPAIINIMNSSLMN